MFDLSKMDTLSWYAIGVPAYVLYIGLELFIARRRARRVFGFAETISNLTAGLGTLVIGLFVGPWVVRSWQLVHDHVAPFPWPEHAWWKLPVAIVLADFCYYVYHRAGHRFALFWSIHGIHHQHEHLNSTVGFRLEWLADPYAALFFGVMPLLGADTTTGFAALAIVSVYALTAHSTILPRRSFGIFVTPAIHGSHHSRDARYAEKNFGAMLGIWDRLFGTWREPTSLDDLRADVPSIARTHDGVRTQWGLVAELGRTLARAGTWRERVRILFAPPVVVGPKAPLRDDASIDRPTRVYVVVQFVALVALGIWLLSMRAPRPLAVQLACAACVIGGLYTLGGLLDGRPHARLLERWRLALTSISGAALTAWSPPLGIAIAVAAIAGIAFSFSLSQPKLLPSRSP